MDCISIFVNRVFANKIPKFMNLLNKTELLEYLKSHGLWAKHGLGQNFLVDREALDKIVEVADLNSDDLVIEVGPGVGTMTEELIKHAKKVIAVELDERLAELLADFIRTKHEAINSKQIQNTQAEPDSRLRGNDKDVSDFEIRISDLTHHLSIINSDILKLNIPELIGEQRYKVVANIPYYITSKIIQQFLTQKNKPESITLLVQKEVAERICAKPGSLSVLAISVQVFGDPEIAGIVKKESFFPSPKVDSAILRIKNIRSYCHPEFISGSIKKEEMLKPVQHDNCSEKAFFRLVHIGFSAKRKTLANNIAVGYRMDKKTAGDIIKSVGLDENTRAQELSLEDWKRLMLKINC